MFLSIELGLLRLASLDVDPPRRPDMAVFSKPAASKAMVSCKNPGEKKAVAKAMGKAPAKKRAAGVAEAKDQEGAGDASNMKKRPAAAEAVDVGAADEEGEEEEEAVDEEEVEEVEGEGDGVADKKLSKKERRRKRQTYVRGHGKVPTGVLPSARSAYALFLKEQYPLFASRNKHLKGSAKQQQTLSGVAQAWNLLPPEKKQKYMEQSKAEVKARHEAKDALFQEGSLAHLKEAIGVEAGDGDSEEDKALALGESGLVANMRDILYNGSYVKVVWATQKTLAHRLQAHVFKSKEAWEQEAAVHRALQRALSNDDDHAVVEAVLFLPNVNQLSRAGHMFFAYEQAEQAGVPLVGDAVPLEERAWATCLKQTATALAYLHNLGFSHCDLKPAAVLWSSVERKACLCHFGLAIKMETVRHRGSGEGVYMNCYTGPYKASELWTHAEEGRGHFPTLATEAWAFGATFLEINVGEQFIRKYTELQRFLAKKESPVLRKASAAAKAMVAEFLQEDPKNRVLLSKYAKAILEEPQA